MIKQTMVCDLCGAEAAVIPGDFAPMTGLTLYVGRAAFTLHLDNPCEIGPHVSHRWEHLCDECGTKLVHKVKLLLSEVTDV